jgi:hypothetical protein
MINKNNLQLSAHLYHKLHDALFGGSSVSTAEAPTDRRLLLLIKYEKLRRIIVPDCIIVIQYFMKICHMFEEF